MSNNEAIQLRFNQDEPSPLTSSEVGTVLGFEELGLGGFPESYLPSGLLDAVVEKKFQFPVMSEKLKSLVIAQYETEKELLGSNLPKASDAEDFMKYEVWGTRGESHEVVKLSQEEVIERFASKNADNLIYRQTGFKDASFIEAELQKVHRAIQEVISKIVILRENHVTKYDLRSYSLEKFNPYDATLPESLQELAILDLHYRNLRDIARTFYMYQKMVEGAVYPTSVEKIVVWQGDSLGIESDQKQKRSRSIAEEVSGELYGTIEPVQWREILYSYLESLKNGELDEDIIQLEHQLLVGLTEESKLKASDNLLLLKRSKEFQKRQAQQKRFVQFCYASRAIFGAESVKVHESRLQVLNQVKNLAEENHFSAQSLQKLINVRLQTGLVGCRSLNELSELFQWKVIDNVSTELMGYQSALAQAGIREEGYWQDIVDILSVTSDDLEAFSDQGSLFDETEGSHIDIDMQLKQRKNSLDMALFIQKVLTDCGIATDIINGSNNLAIHKSELEGNRRVKLVLQDSGMLSLVGSDLSLKIPISRELTAENMIVMFGHEIWSHLGGNERVQSAAPLLINTFSANAPVEGYAKTMEKVIRMWLSSEHDILDVTDTNIIAFYHNALREEYGIEPGELPPINEGISHIIALGLYLGFDGVQSQGRRTPQEVFDIMSKIYRIQYKFSGESEESAVFKAQKDAYLIGVFRQVRGMWPDSITWKNVSYYLGALESQRLAGSTGDDLVRLSMGKVGYAHRVYLEALTLPQHRRSIDKRWCEISRSSILQHIGIAEPSKV